MLIIITRLVRLIGTGLTGIGIARGAKIQVIAVIRAIRTSLRVENLLVVTLFAVLLIIVIVCREAELLSFRIISKIYKQYKMKWLNCQLHICRRLTIRCDEGKIKLTSASGNKVYSIV